ncbi:hypothetical protein PLICRDRAFT_698778 [Plicaturopsis crispa FD-325 SS-3]|nr:hypothetical protein PLICRDRAFT_698778 [Plicaturopsis crispa FD-325 SS-3]
MSLSSFFSSFMPAVYNDAPEEKEEPKPEENNASEEAEEPAAEAEEEEEPEDAHPSIREECQQSAKCAQFTKHFEHCQEKVSGGEGFPHEDCVEEMCECSDFGFLTENVLTLPHRPRTLYPTVHMMHCADLCAAPKLFSKLR